MADLHGWLPFAVACLIALVSAVVVTAVIGAIVRALAKHREWARMLASHLRIPFRLLLLDILAWIAVAATMPREVPQPTVETVHHVFLIVTIALGAWFAAALVIFFEDLGLARYRLDVPDNRYARRVRTQVMIIRRLTIVAAVVVALGAILLTFPGARAAGASILASAGLIGVVAGIAAQSSLGNLFAGMQLAFSGAIRIDDVVVVNNQWGRIEEITLTYVVVHLWDDRRMVLPSTSFTTQPFENWTRRNSELLGAVEFDLDWRVSPAGMRKELDRILRKTDLWDHRTSVLQVTDAVGGYVHVRVLVTAKDAPTLFDLRCYVRENLVAWIQRDGTAGLPRQRVELVEAGGMDASQRSRAVSGDTLFSGSSDGDKRASQFTDSIPMVAKDAGLGERPQPQPRGRSR
ncbi:mechanosensitive ion channel family protein [Humibacter sp.]|uniref:mechanosensitive ion channel family protein n=1 Tax=Humibacter sp. TaxID=1940291 RepID=UPI003F7DB52E